MKICRRTFDETGPEQVYGTLHGYVRHLVDCKKNKPDTSVFAVNWLPFCSYGHSQLMWGQPAGSKKFVYTTHKVIKYILYLFILAEDYYWFLKLGISLS